MKSKRERNNCYENDPHDFNHEHKSKLKDPTLARDSKLCLQLKKTCLDSPFLDLKKIKFSIPLSFLAIQIFPRTSL